MQSVSLDPAQTLVVLPLDEGARMERQWVQTTLAWLKSVPAEARTARLRHLAAGISENPVISQRFQYIWKRGFAPKLYSEAGLPEATSLLREFNVRVKRRLLPHLEDEVDLYAALRTASLDETDAAWVAS